MIQRRLLVTRLSLIASLSALYIVFRLIPTFPLFGIPGATFKAGDFLAPLYGVVLGPMSGPLAIAIGTIVAFSAGAPPVFLGLDFLPSATCAAIVGLATRRRTAESSILNSILIVVFLLLPFTSIFIPVGNFLIPYVWLHLAGLALLVSPITRRAAGKVMKDWKGFKGNSKEYFGNTFWAFLVLAFVGTLGQHLMGGILTQLVVGINFHTIPGKAGQYHTWQDFWTFIFWIYPAERAVIALVSALLGSAAIVALKGSGITDRLPP